MADTKKKTTIVSRRDVLKGAAAVTGTAILGAPAIISAQPVTLRYLGTAVNQSKEIAQKAKADLGVVIEYVPVTTDDVSKRIITQPASFDIADAEYFQLRKLIPSGNLIGMDASRIKYADRITPVFTRGEVAGKKIGDQGTAPKKVFYLEGKNSTKFSASPTQWITPIPTVYNADTSARGRSSSTPRSRASRRSCTSRRSASWTRRWSSSRSACTSIGTRAT